jgi:hypothetical protein
MPRQSLFILALIVAASIHAQAQISPVNTGQPKAPVEKSPDDADAQRILKERRVNARSLLMNLAADARKFADARLRARMQARLADALWNTDREQSRTIFRSAWEAAEVADAEIQARAGDIRQQARNGGRLNVIQVGQGFRNEVLAIVMRRDPELGQEFLTKFKESSPATDERSTAMLQKAATDALNAQMDKSGVVTGNQPQNRNSVSARAQPPPNQTSPVDLETSMRERAEHARTTTERDQTYMQLATMLADKDEGRAHAYGDKIKDPELRNEVRGFLDVSLAWKLVSMKDTERALDLARTGELTHFQKSWLLSQIAGVLWVGDQKRAAQVLEDATAEARRIEAGDADRPRAFFAIANVLLASNPASVWSVMDDAISAANAADKFTGEDGQLSIRLISKGAGIFHDRPFRGFAISGIFTKLALEDYDRTVQLARGLTQDVPRSVATIAIARTVLEQR